MNGTREFASATRSAAAGERPAQRFPTLWPLTLAPLVWAAHFLLTYATGAIWHAKAPDSAGLQATILVYTTLALVGVAAIGVRHARVAAASARTGEGAASATRRSFTGRLGVRLAVLSAVAIAFTQLAAALGDRA